MAGDYWNKVTTSRLSRRHALQATGAGVLGAAFLAAADGGKVTMAHVVQATQREYQKLGKVRMADDPGIFPT
jgi:hypothetical protein